MFSSTAFQKALTKQGMKFILETSVTGAQKKGENWEVSIKDNKTEKVQTVCYPFVVPSDNP